MPNGYTRTAIIPIRCPTEKSHVHIFGSYGHWVLHSKPSTGILPSAGNSPTMPIWLLATLPMILRHSSTQEPRSLPKTRLTNSARDAEHLSSSVMFMVMATRVRSVCRMSDSVKTSRGSYGYGASLRPLMIAR